MKKFIFNIILFSSILSAAFSKTAVKKSPYQNLSRNILEQNADGTEILKAALSKKGKPEKSFQNFIDQYGPVTHWKDENSRTHNFSFFFMPEEKNPSGDFFLHTNLNGFEQVKLNNFENTNIFYTTIKISDLPESISYAYRKKTGKFMKDKNNPLNSSDPKKSSYIRLSDKSGAFTTVENFYPAKKYKKLPPRTNQVYLPAEYFSNPQKSFPVIYMLDGQNLWDNENCPYGGWCVDTILEKLVSEGKMESCIIAGISNSNFRTAEYAGWCEGVRNGEALSEGFSTEDCRILSAEHERMIIEDYIPFIEKNFRVKSGKENRIIAGSSYGAYLASYLLAHNPETFGGAGLFSGGSHGYEQLMNENAFQDSKYKIYLDCGTGDTLEKILITGTRRLHQYLLEKGYTEGKNLLYKEAQNAYHNEKEWSKRVPEFLEFCYPTEK